jgi:hypothetical protein
MKTTENLAYPHVVGVQSAAALKLRPETPEGDEFFGLAAGTNGTAAAMRRRVIESSITTTAMLVWERHNGRAAVGVTLVPSGKDPNANPWSGR